MTLAELFRFQDRIPKQDEVCTCFLLTMLPAKQQQQSCIHLMAMWTFGAKMIIVGNSSVVTEVQIKLSMSPGSPSACLGGWRNLVALEMC